MSEERRHVYARKTRSGKGIYFADNEVVYVASIRSIKAFLAGERDRIAFAKFPYRKSEAEFKQADTILTTCSTCKKMRIFRKVGEDTWECEDCHAKKTTSELIHGLRKLVEGF